CAACGIVVHYALLGTGAYTSMLLWHAGITASAPLLMNTEKNFVSDALDLHGAAAKIPLSQTIFAPYNLVVCALLALLVPPLIVAMQPSKEQTVRADLASIPAPPEAESEERALDAKTPAEWLDRTRILTVVVGVLGLTFLVR